MEKILIVTAGIVFLLVFILAAYLWNRKYILPDDDDIIYVMHAPKNYFWIGAAGLIFAGVFCGLAVIIFTDEEILLPFSVFYVFLVVSLYLCIYSRLWKGVIKTDSLTCYALFFPVKEIKFYEITSVKCIDRVIAGYEGTKKSLEGYKKKKKVFSIEETIDGFELLYCLLEQSGKIERASVKENFSVTAAKKDMVLAAITLPSFCVLFAVMVWEREEVGLLYVIASGAILLGCLPQMLWALIWRVTVDFHTISVRNRFGAVKTYDISRITEVMEQECYIVLYEDGNKIAKIPKDGENFEYLMEWLRRWARDEKASASEIHF